MHVINASDVIASSPTRAPLHTTSVEPDLNSSLHTSPLYSHAIFPGYTSPVSVQLTSTSSEHGHQRGPSCNRYWTCTLSGARRLRSRRPARAHERRRRAVHWPVGAHVRRPATARAPSELHYSCARASAGPSAAHVDATGASWGECYRSWCFGVLVAMADRAFYYRADWE